MKRPVFCVALAYALGEVIGLYTRTVGEIGIVSAMLVCVGIFVRKKKQGKSACVLGLGIGLGMLGAFLRIPQDLREKPDIRQENGYDIITYATGGETQGQPVICAGILTDRQGETWTMRVLDGADVHGDILLRGVEGEHTIAEIVQVTGTYDIFEHVRNPGGFQSRSYYLARNISGYYYAPQVTTITVNQREILGLPRYLYYQGKRILYELRIRADCQIAKLLPEEQASLVSGILLGEKSRIDAELKTLYQMGGIAHILAISGLHISLLGGLLFRLMRRARVPIPAAGIITIAGLLLYGMMTGMSLATMRAIWMMVIFLVAQMFGKSYDMPTAMGIALFFMLLCNPVRILDAGMQLSYMAIAGVSLGNYGMKRLHKKTGFRRFQKRYPLRFRVVQSLFYSVTLQGMMLLVVAKTYYEIPVYAGLLNLIVVPGMTVVVAGSWFGLLVSIGTISLGRFVMLPVGWMLQGYTWLCERTLELPWNTLVTREIRGWQIGMWYGGIACTLVLLRTKTRNKLRDFVYKHTGRFWRKREVVRYTVCTILISMLLQGAGQALCVWQQRTEAIYFLDVGQGDGILIRSPDGRNIVIDGGSTSQSKCGTYTLLPALRSQGMTEIDCWFVTHTDEDHISGIRELLEGQKLGVRIDTLVLPPEEYHDEKLADLARIAVENGTRVVSVKTGANIYGRGERQTEKNDSKEVMRLRCIGPLTDIPQGLTKPKAGNEASLVLEFSYGNFDMLFTGDVEGAGEELLVKSDVLRKYEILKCAHHGSKNSGTAAFLEKTDPRAAIISAGIDNRYGHPHEETLNRLKKRKVKTYNTQTDGAVTIKSDGIQISIESFLLSK